MIDLEFHNVSKRYRVRREAARDAAPAGHPLQRLRSMLPRYNDFWAVRDVTFDVQHGEALGIIGHNGAGKSTILKLISSITAPTAGEIRIHGRLAALIEVGSGFHPDLTGRENVYLSGSILGMRRREIDANLERIVEFAGVREFIDTPVKRFSSGMYVRLGFAIAAHLNPDVLLLDEVLAVGDAAFQAKCLERIGELKQQGTTIVFISHDLAAVEQLCDRVILMRKGQIAAEGAPHETIAEYNRSVTNLSRSPNSVIGGQNLSRRAEITGVSFLDEHGEETSALRTARPMTARIEYFAHEPVADAVFELFVNAEQGDGWLACQLTTELDDERIDLAPGAGYIEFDCDMLGLRGGVYRVDVGIKRLDPPEDIDMQPHCAVLRVDPGRIVRGGVFHMPYRWRVVQERGSAVSTHEEENVHQLAG